MRKSCLSLGIAALVMVASLSHAEQPVIDLPQIGNPADVALSPNEENRLGKEIAGELYFYNYVVEDPEIEEYLAIGRRRKYGLPIVSPLKDVIRMAGNGETR